MYWKHEVNADWLRARNSVLTASQIKSLLPDYKKWVKNPEYETPGFLALAYEKWADREPDTVSTGAAARGHILEPYAIQEYNMLDDTEIMFHWDDVVIVNQGLGYSPDAMDIPMNVSGVVKMNAEDIGEPTSVLEIKSYEPKHHLKSILESKDKAEERWQIATAFAVLPTLQRAELVNYCPGTYAALYRREFSREEVNEELDIIDKIARLFYSRARELNAILKDYKFTSAYTEDFIYKEYCACNSDKLMGF